MCVRRTSFTCLPSEPQGKQTNDPWKCEFWLLVFTWWLRDSYRHTFSEAFGRLKNWVNLLAGCKKGLWKTEGTKEKNLLHISRQEICFSLPFPSRWSSSQRQTERFPSPDMEQVVIGIIGLSRRFRCQLKCNCYTCLIDLNNLLNEFILVVKKQNNLISFFFKMSLGMNWCYLTYIISPSSTFLVSLLRVEPLFWCLYFIGCLSTSLWLTSKSTFL